MNGSMSGCAVSARASFEKTPEETEEAMMVEEGKRDRNDPFREGVRAVTGFLGALKDAIEEQFDELRESGDLSPERAREAARSTMRKAQDTVEDVKDRLDFVTRREFDDLREEVAALRRQLDAHAATAHTTPGGAGNAGGEAAGAGGFPIDGG
jgi:polyhydroxyalkanoate synthesis regulator phasin